VGGFGAEEEDEEEAEEAEERKLAKISRLRMLLRGRADEEEEEDEEEEDCSKVRNLRTGFLEEEEEEEDEDEEEEVVDCTRAGGTEVEDVAIGAGLEAGRVSVLGGVSRLGILRLVELLGGTSLGVGDGELATEEPGISPGAGQENTT